MKIIFSIIILFNCFFCNGQMVMVRVVQVLDIQKIGVVDWFKKQHQNDELFYCIEIFKTAHIDGWTTNCHEIYKPKGWATVGQIIQVELPKEYERPKSYIYDWGFSHHKALFFVQCELKDYERLEQKNKQSVWSNFLK